MTLSGVIRFAVAPHFHLDIDWSARLSLGASVQPTAPGLVEQPFWRSASAGELAEFVFDPTRSGARKELSHCACLFVVPMHIRAAFWDLLARGQEEGGIPTDGFNTFAGEVARFLAFKELPLPAGAVCELVVNPPGKTATTGDSSAWGRINFGEDAVSVVCTNVEPGGNAVVDCRGVRLRLEPGEGLRVPAGALLDNDGEERTQPEVLLVIRSPRLAT
jgi:hypothetical protein